MLPAINKDIRMRLRWAAIIALLLLLGFVGYRVWLPPKVAVEQLAPGALEQRLIATGRVISPERIAIGSMLVGTAVEVLVEEGQRVEPDQSLLRLDARELEAAAQRAESKLAQAKANLRQLEHVRRRTASEALTQADLQLRQTQRDYQRAVELARENYTSQSELEARKEALDLATSRRRSAELTVAALQDDGSEYQAALAAVAEANAAHAEALARLDHTQIRAPTAGTILRRDVDPGDVVQPGAPLLLLASAGETRIEAQLDERNLRLAEIGQPAIAAADAYPQRQFEASVRLIAPTVDAQRGTVKIELTVPTPPDHLRADMTVTVDILAARRERALSVPRSAVREAAGQPWVLVLRDGRAKRQEVALGLSGDGRIELRSGAEAGSRIVLAPDAIQPGQRIRPREVTR